MNSATIYMMLFIGFQLARVNLFGKVGISLTFFLIFTTVFQFGAVLAILMAGITGFFSMLLAVAETGIDHAIEKNLGAVVKKTFFFAALSIFIAGVFYFVGTQYVLEHMFFIYLFCLAGWTIPNKLIIVGRLKYDVKADVIGPFMHFVFNFYFMKYAGLQVLQWLNPGVII